MTNVVTDILGKRVTVYYEGGDPWREWLTGVVRAACWDPKMGTVEPVG